jgi:hypothetical protein
VPNACRPLFDEAGVFVRVLCGGDVRDRDRPVARRRPELAERGRVFEDPGEYLARLLRARSALEQEAQPNKVEA